jgi:DNA repair protein RadC
MEEYTQKLSIKQWAEEDRPREKLLLKGKSALSEAELLAILIGSGNTEESAVTLCQKILHDHGNDLNELGRLSVSQLMKYKGIGEAKAISIVAALELGRRRQMAVPGRKPELKSSHQVYELMGPLLADLPHEEFHVLYLNRANRLKHRERLSSGGISGTVADVRMMMATALQVLASGIIVCHNHPSGSLRPSQQDIQLTKKVKDAAALLDLAMVDHLIIADSGYFSFADEGML